MRALVGEEGHREALRALERARVLLPQLQELTLPPGLNNEAAAKLAQAWLAIANPAATGRALEVVPHQGVGPWRLGASRDEVLAVLGAPDDEFRDHLARQDRYDRVGLTFTYRRSEPRAIGIGFKGPVRYDGWVATGRSYEEARTHFEAKGHTCVFSWAWDSLYVRELGLWLHCHQQELPVDEVTVTTADYLDAFLPDSRLAATWRAEGVV